MNKKLLFLFSWVMGLTLPIITLAQNTITQPGYPSQGNVINFWTLFNGVFSAIVWPIFIGAVMITFIVAGIIFLTANGNEEKIRLARRALIWGTVGVVVGILAISAYYLINNVIFPPAPAQAPAAPGAGTCNPACVAPEICVNNSDCETPCASDADCSNVPPLRTCDATSGYCN